MTPHEISAKIFYSPDAIDKGEGSIKKGAEIIEEYAKKMALEAWMDREEIWNWPEGRFDYTHSKYLFDKWWKMQNENVI